MKNKILSVVTSLAVICGAFAANAASSASDNSKVMKCILSKMTAEL